jgi:replicative DNA helicase
MSAERELPVSIEAEQAVLGGLLLSPVTLPKVADWLTEGDFHQADHRLIFRAILALAAADKPFDPVTLGEWLEANDAPGLGGYLIDMGRA